MSTNTITIEESGAAFVAPDLSNVPVVRRFDSKGDRFYYTLDDECKPTFYPSVTSVIRATTPMAPGLLDWYSRLGMDEAQRIMNEKAAYGTCLHILCGSYLMGNNISLDNLETIVKVHAEMEGLTFDTSWWPRELAKDLLSFATFCNEKEVKPIAIEIPLVSETLGYAGALDLTCELTFNRKRVRAIVDIKSGKKGFHEDYEIQLEAYRQLWNDQFPTMPIDMVFNWAPKDWREKPTYDLKNQSESDARAKWPLLLQIYTQTVDVKPRPRKEFKGSLKMGIDVAECYEIIEMDKWLQRYHLEQREQTVVEAADVDGF